TIPLLCLSLWAGNWIGAWAITPIKVEAPKLTPPAVKRDFVVELGPLITFRITGPNQGRTLSPSAGNEQRLQERLRIQPARFGRALWLVGGLIFAVTGYTMWLSAAGR